MNCPKCSTQKFYFGLTNAEFEYKKLIIHIRHSADTGHLVPWVFSYKHFSDLSVIFVNQHWIGSCRMSFFEQSKVHLVCLKKDIRHEPIQCRFSRSDRVRMCRFNNIIFYVQNGKSRQTSVFLEAKVFLAKKLFLEHPVYTESVSIGSKPSRLIVKRRSSVDYHRRVRSSGTRHRTP